VAEGVVRRRVGRRQVVVAGSHEDLHVRVAGQRGAQRLARVRVLALIPLPPRIDLGAERLVLQVGFVAQVAVHVIVEHGRVGRHNRGVGRVELRLFGDGQRVLALEARVQAADRALFVAQQLLAEAHDLDAQARTVDVARLQAAVAGQLLDHGLALAGGQPVAFGQGDQVFRPGPGFHLIQHGPQRLLLQIRRQLAVVPGGGRVGGQEEGIRQIVALLELQRLEVEGG